MKSNTPLRGLLALVFIFGLVAAARTSDFNASADASTLRNPVPIDSESIARGKMLYLRHCRTCHGALGKGDGPQAGMDPGPGDLTDTIRMRAQTDGELFSIITRGHGKMKPYAEIAPTQTDREKWDIVNYVRTLVRGGRIVVTPGKPPVNAPREAQAMIDAYLNLVSALNAADLTSATQCAERLDSSAFEGATTGLPEPVRIKAETIAFDIEDESIKFQEAANLADARKSFAVISKSIDNWLTLTTFRFDEPLSVYQCSATSPGNAAVWIQQSGPPLNPYGLPETSGRQLDRKIPAAVIPR